VARTVVVVTDGFVGVEAQAFRFIRERLGEANLFAFGIGSSVNRGLIEGMARAGLGEPFVVLRPEAAPAAAEKLRALIEQPVLTDIHVDFQNVDAVEVAPAHVPDLLARRPLVVYGKLRGSANGRIVVSGMTGQGRFEQAVHLRQADVRAENAPLRWLWARKWVETLEDERHMGGGKAVEEAITNLGLGYSLLTAFTSFVAVDSAVVNRGGAGETVKQPLPLPEGVSNQAVGQAAGVLGAANAPMKAGAPRMKLEDNAPEGLQLQGSGSGGGGLGRVVRAPAPVASAMPPVPPSVSPAPSNEPADKPAHRRAPSAKPPAPAARDVPSVSLSNAVALGDTGPLVHQLEALLVRAGCARRPGGSALTLKLTIDGAGKIVTASLVRGDARLLACLEGRLVGLVTATRAASGGTGTVEVVVRL
jgi:hypothetical protein